ncbi:hypothetical protein ACIRYZ_31270 [Kitasatospora sp. NPDC101155]|uniref:hypothetical protein n=1 Tax=Kitasatospora sp. NPDC101155 TaxID=3364097 RepID=UPI0038268D16
MTWYLTVRSDCRYGESVSTCVLVTYLDSVPGLRRTGLSSYQTEEGLDWIHVTIAACNSTGSYAVYADRVPQRVNKVLLICSSSGGGYAIALALAEKIADLLGWEVADDESDEVQYTAPAIPVPARCAVECSACATPGGRQSSLT